MQRIVNRDEALERLRWRYAQRGKEGKSVLLDEFCEQHGFERKYAIKLLGSKKPRMLRKPRGPLPRYEPVEEVLGRIWGAAEQICGKRLVQALPLWLPHYQKHYGQLLPAQQKLLKEISAATVNIRCSASANQENQPVRK